MYFNPRPPRGGRRTSAFSCKSPLRFQSTPPARGATAAAFLLTKQQYYISIHAPREGGDSPEPRRQPFPTNFNPRPREGGDAATVRGWATAAGISIHAPRVGGDGGVYRASVQINISIHAPREGGDLRPKTAVYSLWYFNPRPPRGGRLDEAEIDQWPISFQSTPPARGATLALQPSAQGIEISIHAPREGGDGDGGNRHRHQARFQSTPPAKGATLWLV